MEYLVASHYILQAVVEEQLLKICKQCISSGNYPESALKALDCLTILKRRRDSFIFASSNLTINQEGRLLMRQEAKG